MSGPDGEFDDFLARRKPVFRRAEVDPLEPPAELDRIVLRRAREAIESDRPEPMYHGPRWGMPVALAATILVAVTVILHVATQNKERVPEVTVQNVARDLGVQHTVPPAATPLPQAPVTAAPPPPPSVASTAAPSPGAMETASGQRPVTDTSTTPAWRNDDATWQAEIQRLRAAGKNEEAELEQAEYNRRHRAYAGAPDR